MSNYRNLLFLAITFFFLPRAVSAQTISVERSRVLSHYGDSEAMQLSLPMSTGVGIVSTQVIKRSGASALRAHFAVSVPPSSPSWGVQISDKHAKKIWSYSAMSNPETGFWSDEIPGDTAKVEVFSLAEGSQLRLTVDQIVVSRNPSVVRSLTVNKLMAIDKASPEIRQWGRSVARLLFVGDGNGQFLCTGFLVGPDLFLTNNHCIKTDSEMSSGLAEFDYDALNATPITLRFKEILTTNPGLDFTLLRLSANSGRQPLSFDVNGLSEGRSLVVIEHPAGRPKQVSIENCKVFGAQIAGVTPALTDFGHGCDTLGGSSGSPVMDIGSGRVLGLHHLGFLPNDQPVNRAVRIQDILNFLNQNLADAAARQALGLPAQ